MGARPVVTLRRVSEPSDRAHLIDGLGRVLRRPWRIHEAGRNSLDAFAERYGKERGMEYRLADDTPPATWFLEAVEPARSHSFLRGPLAGGPAGTVFFAERGVTVRRQRQMMTGWTVAVCDIAGATRLAYGIACLFAPGSAWGGRVKLPVDVPRTLVVAPPVDPSLPDRYLVAVSAGDEVAVGELFDAAFVGWLAGLPWRRTGEELIRFELRNGRLCVYAKPKARTAQALDAFCERAAHITRHVTAVTAAL